MNLQQETHEGRFHIKRFEPGKIWINETCYENNIILRPDKLETWTACSPSTLTAEDLAPLFDDKPEILIIGTGEKLILTPQAPLTKLYEQGIGVELMDNKAACYTYTVLACDKRRVCACLFIS